MHLVMQIYYLKKKDNNLSFKGDVNYQDDSNFFMQFV